MAINPGGGGGGGGWGGGGLNMVHVKKLTKPSEFYSLFTKFITFCFLQIHLGYIMQYLPAIIMMQLKTTVIICINHGRKLNIFKILNLRKSEFKT